MTTAELTKSQNVFSQTSNFSSLVFYIIFAFIALSGFGILFLNEESILAVCFFVFFYLIIRNSDAMSDTLNEQKQLVRSELVSCLLGGQKTILEAQMATCYKKTQLIQSLEAIMQRPRNTQEYK